MSMYICFSPKAHQKQDHWTQFIFHDLRGISSATAKQKPIVVPFISKSEQIIHLRSIKMRETKI